MILTSLQREANSMWSWTSKRTLSVAQQLYDTHKLTTYPRTDSRYLPEDMIETIGKTIAQLGAQNHLQPHSQRLKQNGLQNVSRNFNDSKVSRPLCDYSNQAKFPKAILLETLRSYMI